MADDYGFGAESVETGFDELMAKLDRFGAALGRPTEERMIRAGAQVGKEEMVRLAPELAEKNSGSDSLEPGELKRGIRILIPKNGEVVEARVGPRGAKLVRIATDVEYGHRQVHKGTAGADVPAHPFVRPAYEGTARRSEEAMISELDKTITETMG